MVPKANNPTPLTAQGEELARLFREFRELQEAWGDLPPSTPPTAVPPGRGEEKGDA